MRSAAPIVAAGLLLAGGLWLALRGAGAAADGRRPAPIAAPTAEAPAADAAAAEELADLPAAAPEERSERPASSADAPHREEPTPLRMEGVQRGQPARVVVTGTLEVSGPEGVPVRPARGRLGVIVEEESARVREQRMRADLEREFAVLLSTVDPAAEPPRPAAFEPRLADPSARTPAAGPAHGLDPDLAQGLRYAFGEEGRGALPTLGRFTTGSHSVSVDVAGGAWALDVEEGAWLTFGRLEVEGRTAQVTDPPGRGQVPPDHWLPLQARWVQPIEIHARDPRTGVELADVELVLSAVEPADAPVQPRRWTVGRGLDSPVAVDERFERELRFLVAQLGLRAGFDREGLPTIHAHAPGRAWASAELPLTLGGPCDLFLPVEGELQLLPSLASPRALVLVGPAERPGARPYAAIPVQRGSGVLVVGALPPGRASVRLVRQDGDSFAVAARQEVEVLEGQRVALQLVEPPPPPRRVAVGGPLVLGSGWDPAEIRLLLHREDPGGPERAPVEARIQDGVSGLTWSAGELLPGSFLAEVLPAGVGQRFRIAGEDELLVGASGPVTIRVPPRVEVSVRVVDERTDAPLDVRAVGWRTSLDRELGREPRPAERSEPGLFRFTAASTDLSVELLDPACAPATAATASARELRLATRRRPGLRVVYRSAGQRFRGPAPDVVGLDEGCEVVAREATSDSHAVYVSRPGRYRLTFPAVEGRVTPEPREVLVAAEGLPEIAGEYRRAP